MRLAEERRQQEEQAEREKKLHFRMKKKRP